MKTELDFLSSLHTRTKRDYLGRVNEFPKAEAATIAKKFGAEYWDGDRKFGYGGYKYDGRWRSIAEKLASHYELKPGSSVLDVGCGRAFLLYELTQVVPELTVRGLDISQYGIGTAKEEVRASLLHGSAIELPFESDSFDLAISLNTFHNLYCYELFSALKEFERIAKNKYLCVESYRNEEEKANLLYWQLTCESFHTPAEWRWWFDLCDYTGDYSFIFFE